MMPVMNILPLTYSFGALEIAAIVLVIIPTAILFSRGHSFARFFMAASISMVAAALISPADLVSTIFLGTLFFAMFGLGLKMSKLARSAVS